MKTRASLNWVIGGVNYIISCLQCLLWHQKICKLVICALPEQSDWCDNMPIHSHGYAHVLPVSVSRPYFSTRLQGTCAKNFVSGDGTRLLSV